MERAAREQTSDLSDEEDDEESNDEGLGDVDFSNDDAVEDCDGEEEKK